MNDAHDTIKLYSIVDNSEQHGQALRGLFVCLQHRHELHRFHKSTREGDYSPAYAIVCHTCEAVPCARQAAWS